MTENRIWPRPVIIPEPCAVAGTESPVISLSGTWKLATHPVDNFWENKIDPSSWQDIEVPSTLRILGIRVPNNSEYAYKRTITIPEDFRNKTIKIRFDAVNCEARVWIDGQFVRGHWGGYNAWDADITPYVTPGHSHILTVGVIDRVGVASQFHFGGIIRDVRLIAVPKTHLERIHVQTDLDAEYCDAVLRIFTKVSEVSGDTKVRLKLTAPCGKDIDLAGGIIQVKDNMDIDQPYPISNPIKWDAEHTNLYTLDTELLVEGQVVETYRQKIGFRKVERREDQVFVNGVEVKLRGVDREEIHPLKGRSISNKDIEDDVRLLKAANVNFVRTSHYNPSKYFLDLCDIHGIYVEEETSISFVGQGQNHTNDDPAYTPHYMNQFAEMIEKDRSHPSVIIWSLANESMWGDNFRKELAYARAEDPTRLTIFSYPITMQQEDEMVDIWSTHYNLWNTDPTIMSDNTTVGGWFGPHRYPVLHDEYIHIPCYNRSEIRRDQGVRDFWGESVKRFWDSIYDTKGALGGAIWCGIDEVWLCKDHPDATAEWGIIDGFRREKPEHWLTKKGYSPIRIEAKQLGNPGAGSISVPIYNRYNHTNLNELTIRWSVGAESGDMRGPDLAPRCKGTFELPARTWQNTDVVALQFVEPSGLVCDEFRLPVSLQKGEIPAFSSKAPVVVNQDSQITVSGGDFIYTFNKTSGLLQLTGGGEPIVKEGPYLNLVGLDLEPWKCDSLEVKEQSNLAVAAIHGGYGPVKVTFVITIDGEGLMRVDYTVDEMPYPSPRSQKMGYGKDVGGYTEVGIYFLLPSGMDRLSWVKDGLWDYYPDNHIGRRAGTAKKLRNDRQEEEVYRQTPEWDWKDDMRNYMLFGQYDMGGRGTKDFVSTKSYIFQSTVYSKASGAGITALSDGSDSIRLQLKRNQSCMVDDRDPRVKYYGSWQQYADQHGCYCNTETYSKVKGDYAEFTFEGTGVCWIGKKHVIYGMAEVYVDGKLMDQEISLMPMGGSGAIRGLERAYDEMLYTIEGLPYGQHTLRIVVKGEKSPGRNFSSYNTYVSIDAFLVLGEHLSGDIQMNINGQFNYPELVWGDYMKDPIFVDSGYHDKVYLKPYKK